MSQSQLRPLHAVFSLFDLTALSISSVAPAFSISATIGLMAGLSGLYSIWGIVLLAVPFLVSSYTFRLLNRHFPHAGASYHWSRRVLGPKIARFQGWIIVLAYFSSLPPILVPAARYTLALIAPNLSPSPLWDFAIGTFWLLFALMPLLSGAKPTARVTQIFFLVEIVCLLLIASLAIWAFPHIHVPPSHHPFHLRNLLPTMVIAATIMDGWEIDSYASEESTHPNRDPGLAGIIGALFALVIYIVFIPLILLETSNAVLARSTAPMLLWAERLPATLLPHAQVWMIIPILASTAGSLWLTAYILIRALFAMGRDGFISRAFSQVNRRNVPAFATWITFLAVWTVMALQLWVSSLDAFFNIVLSLAGFFIILEFTLDNITAVVFLWRAHPKDDLHRHRTRSHSHRIMLVGSGFTTLYLGLLLLGFMVESARMMSPMILPILGILLAIGILLAQLSHPKAQPQGTSNPRDDDVV